MVFENIVCPSCSYSLHEISFFCPNCGVQFELEESPKKVAQRKKEEGLESSKDKNVGLILVIVLSLVCFFASGVFYSMKDPVNVYKDFIMNVLMFNAFIVGALYLVSACIILQNKLAGLFIARLIFTFNFIIITLVLLLNLIDADKINFRGSKLLILVFSLFFVINKVYHSALKDNHKNRCN